MKLLLNVIYLPMKFQENILQGYGDMLQTSVVDGWPE